MPELPEVEHVARTLRAFLDRRRIISAKLLRPKLAPSVTPQEFAIHLKAAVASVGRRGKFLLIFLTNERLLLVHLRMTGRFTFIESGTAFPKFTHATFDLDNGQTLIFLDQRHFGFMKIVNSVSLEEVRELTALAPEPLSDEFTVDFLRHSLSRSHRTLKEVLIDQKRVSGLGNIYASEVLFEARINPFAISARISSRRVPRLHTAIRNVLSRSIDSSLKAPLDLKNMSAGFYWGGNSGRWAVYDREGAPCDNCGEKIRRVMHSGRSTYFCQSCQRY